ncbi:crotonyl-CoA carboxylase/reductase [bacterium]|nr:MAG: crotonyl-CoA carboxylase/reductase [bacterium]
MFAQVVRQDRFGDPRTAFQIEQVAVPEIRPDEVLIRVMAAGVNFNNVWAARGVPIDVIASRQRAGEPWDFHIGGSDASGVVQAVGSAVTNVHADDEVIVHPGYWDAEDPWVKSGRDPMVNGRIWGYDTNFGSFAEFCVAQGHQVLPKAEHLTWEEAAAPTLVGTTAYRMLHGWRGHEVKRGDVVLVWGGSGGLGGQAVQLCRLAGARAVAVVSSDERGEYCKRLGAAGYVDRKQFNHWGVPPHWDDAQGQKAWTGEARRFGKAIWEALGERRNPAIVFEHPGEETIPISIFVCEEGGMVVICAGTTGYSAMVDVRYLWVRQKRFQGSHGCNDEQAIAYNDLVRAGKIDPCLGRVVKFEEVGQVHHEMGEGSAPAGNTVVLVGAAQPGLGRRSDKIVAD